MDDLVWVPQKSIRRQGFQGKKFIWKMTPGSQVRGMEMKQGRKGIQSMVHRQAGQPCG